MLSPEYERIRKSDPTPSVVAGRNGKNIEMAADSTDISFGEKASVRRAPTEAILESLSGGVFTMDPEWRVSSFSKAAEERMEWPAGDIRCLDGFLGLKKCPK